MLRDTRLAPYFHFTGSFDEHFGAFVECESQVAATCEEKVESSCC